MRARGSTAQNLCASIGASWSDTAAPLDDLVVDDRVVLLEINPIGSTYPGHSSTSRSMAAFGTLAMAIQYRSARPRVYRGTLVPRLEQLRAETLVDKGLHSVDAWPGSKMRAR